MKFKQIVPYKIRRAVSMAAIAGLPLLPASCTKLDPHHDTTYVWNIYTWNNAELGQKVAASADSTIVDHVFLECDGSNLGGCATTRVLNRVNKVLDYVTPENRYKVRGAGVLNYIWIRDEQCIRDSVTLSQMGFKFGIVLHRDFQKQAK